MADDTMYQGLLNRLGWVLCALSIVVVGARIYSRAVVGRTFAMEDHFMSLALVCIFSCMLSLTIMTRYM